MTDDLVKRLRAASHDDRLATGMLYREAANEIEGLRAGFREHIDRVSIATGQLLTRAQDAEFQRDALAKRIEAALPLALADGWEDLVRILRGEENNE